MESKETFWKGFFAQMAVIFTIDILFLVVLSSVFGDSAKELSTLFRLGEAGLANETLMQHLFAAVVLTIINKLCFTEILFHKMMVLWRTVIMLFCTVAFMVVCIIGFGWFPATAVPGWIGFIVCFGLCFGVSTAIMILKTKLESKRYEQMLEKYRDREEAEDGK